MGKRKNHLAYKTERVNQFRQVDILSATIFADGVGWNRITGPGVDYSNLQRDLNQFCFNKAAAAS